MVDDYGYQKVIGKASPISDNIPAAVSRNVKFPKFVWVLNQYINDFEQDTQAVFSDRTKALEYLYNDFEAIEINFDGDDYLEIDTFHGDVSFGWLLYKVPFNLESL